MVPPLLGLYEREDEERVGLVSKLVIGQLDVITTT